MTSWLGAKTSYKCGHEFSCVRHRLFALAAIALGTQWNSAADADPRRYGPVVSRCGALLLRDVDRDSVYGNGIPTQFIFVRPSRLGREKLWFSHAHANTSGLDPRYGRLAHAICGGNFRDPLGPPGLPDF